MLTVSGVSDRHSLLAAFCFHGGDVKDKVGVLDAGSGGSGRSPDHAVLAEGVADAADLEVRFRNLDLAAHGVGLASVLAVRVRIARLEKHLVVLAFPTRQVHAVTSTIITRFFMPAFGEKHNGKFGENSNVFSKLSETNDQNSIR